MRSQTIQNLRPDSAYFKKILHVIDAARFPPVLRDGAGEMRSHPGERCKLLRGSAVERNGHPQGHAVKRAHGLEAKAGA
jgi:hypothetical protein